MRALQRLLAHKVAQYHGLQTSTADYEGSTGRVVAHRKNVEGKVRRSVGWALAKDLVGETVLT